MGFSLYEFILNKCWAVFETIFKGLPIGVYVKQFDISGKKGQGQPNVIILLNIVGPMSP